MTAAEGKSGTAPADPSLWSEESQRSVAAEFVTEYKDIHYKCWHCSAPAVFTAKDQKYTYEVKKANIHQRRILCRACWEESLQITRELADCDSRWASSKDRLSGEKDFLLHWLGLLERLEFYVPYRADTAKINMLKRLLRALEGQ